MTAQEFWARADAPDVTADVRTSDLLKLQLKASARDWRELGDLAGWQDAKLAMPTASSDRRTSP
jgi:hypothetical protein